MRKTEFNVPTSMLEHDLLNVHRRKIGISTVVSHETHKYFKEEAKAATVAPASSSVPASTSALGPGPFNVNVYQPGTSTVVGQVSAKYLQDTTGNYILDPNTSLPYIVPANYNPATTVNKFAAMNPIIVANDAAIGDGLSPSDAAASAAAVNLAFSYKAGGANDIQRSYGGVSYGGFVKDFQDAASFDFGLGCRSTGFSLSTCEAGGGYYNFVKSIFNSNINSSGVDGNNPQNVPNIQAGSNYFDSSFKASVPISLNSSDFINETGVANSNALKITTSNGISFGVEAAASDGAVDGAAMGVSAIIDTGGNNTIHIGQGGTLAALAGGDVLNGDAGSHLLFGVGGSGNTSYGTVTGTAVESVSANGWNNQIYLNPGSTFESFYGNNDSIHLSGGTVYVGGSSTQAVLGSNDNVHLTAAGEVVTANGVSSAPNTITLDGYFSGDDVIGSYLKAVAPYASGELNIDGNYDQNDTSGSVTWLGTTTGDTTGPNPTYISDPTLCEDDNGDLVDDPIILKLSGGSVQTTSLTGSTAYFDTANIGMREHTGWITSGEGLLVYDPRNTNTVTGDQSLVPGFSALTAFDSNHDGVLNSLDSAWSSLKVWSDTSGTGAFQAGSLATMSQLGIASISLKSSHVDTVNNGNKILDDSIFTWNSGATGDIAGVSFRYDPSAYAHVSGGGNGGGGGGASCVQYQSLLPGGALAGDMEVGSRMELADEFTLESADGVVTYSERKRAPGYRIVTVSGIALVCSDTAPIPTRHGLILAPELMGHDVAVRKDEGGSSLVGWEKIASVTAVGQIEIQHISINERCFWAGESKDAFILHHNKVHQ